MAQGGALPYPDWRLAGTQAIGGRARSTVFAATDPHDGRGYEIREFIPAQDCSSAAHKRRFVGAAKNLRTSSISTMRTWFPYTLNGLCYVVSKPAEGVALERLLLPGGVSEVDGARCLESMLQALGNLHGMVGSEGPLFIGGFELRHVLVQGQSLSDRFEFRDSLYLENILAETPLSPEQAMELDVQSAAEVALGLVAKNMAAGRQRLAGASQIGDTVFGAALEHILHPASGQRPSAKQALLHLGLLRKAEASGSPADWHAAYALSGATRLKERAQPGQVFVPPPPPFVPAAPAAAAAPAHPVNTRISPPAGKVWTAAGAPAQAAEGVGPAKQPPKRKSGISATQGCLGSVVIGLGLLMLLVVRACSPSPTPVEQSVVFGVGPNPVARGQQATLTWAATGYTALRINDAPKPMRGSETFFARRTMTYRLVASDSKGHLERRQVTLVVQAAKPIELPLAPPAESVAAETPAPDPSSAPAAESTPGDNAPVTPASDPEHDAAAVGEVLTRWAEAINAGDPEAEAAFYAPHVERYFLQHDVSNSYIYQYLKHLRDTGAEFRNFSLSEPSVAFADDGSARVSLIERFTAKSTDPAGVRQVSTRSELHLRKFHDGWKIVFQRDFSQ